MLQCAIDGFADRESAGYEGVIVARTRVISLQAGHELQTPPIERTTLTPNGLELHDVPRQRLLDP
jgi:hypothetical protein